MGRKTHLVERDGDGDLHLYPLSSPNFTKPPLNKMKISSKKPRNSILPSSSDHTIMNLNRSSYDPTKFNHSPETFSSPSSTFRCDYSRNSVDFYTPSCQSVISRNMKQSDQSPKCLSISTVYESAIDHAYTRGGFDIHGKNHAYSPKTFPNSVRRRDYNKSPSTSSTSSGHAGASFPVLSSVAEEMSATYRQRRLERGKPDQFARAIPVITKEVEDEEEHKTPVNRPKPYQEFLDEVQKHRSNAEHSAKRKAVYTLLLDKLREKETVIDDWESDRRSKEESKMEKTERNLEKKRVKALQKMHKKLAKISMECERKKARERRCFLKRMETVSGKRQTSNNKVKATMFFGSTWPCCWVSSASDESP